MQIYKLKDEANIKFTSQVVETGETCITTLCPDTKIKKEAFFDLVEEMSLYKEEYYSAEGMYEYVIVFINAMNEQTGEIDENNFIYDIKKVFFKRGQTNEERE